jgi:hypothetical protein
VPRGSGPELPSACCVAAGIAVSADSVGAGAGALLVDSAAVRTGALVFFAGWLAEGGCAEETVTCSGLAAGGGACLRTGAGAGAARVTVPFSEKLLSWGGPTTPFCGGVEVAGGTSWASAGAPAAVRQAKAATITAKRAFMIPAISGVRDSLAPTAPCRRARPTSSTAYINARRPAPARNRLSLRWSRDLLR